MQIFEEELQQEVNNVQENETDELAENENNADKPQHDSETVPEELSPSNQEEENAPSQKELLEKMMLMDQKLDSLAEKFDDKIQTDTYKNQLFDQMHNQLRKYQDDVLEAIREPIITELLDLLDGLKKYEKHMPEEATQENLGKMKKRFSDVREDLEDILENMDVCKYETDPQQPEPKRQKIIKTVQTELPEQNNQIAEKLSDGYLYQNRILKYEKVAIYKYKENIEADKKE